MNDLALILQKYRKEFHPVVEFDPSKEKLMQMDFTASNTSLSTEVIAETSLFSSYVERLLKSSGAKYGIGGYQEDRVLYKRSALFDGEEARSIHLGTDIWGPAGTKVFAPWGGMVHSVANNKNFGDYGATIILQHQLETIVFHTLYGHLSLKDIANLRPGAYVNRGDTIGHFGAPSENGDWPPHLHFQLIGEMHLKEGDYPGVCSSSEKHWYFINCPDPDLVLNLNQFLKP